MELLKTQVFIIGGGATGTGVARDLSLRGVKCILVEKKAINAGASGANHGLLHSGARYVSSDPESAKECRDDHMMGGTTFTRHLGHVSRKLVFHRFCQHAKRLF